MALFLFHNQPTYLYRMRPIPVGKDRRRKDRGGVDGRDSHGRVNVSVSVGGRRVRTRKTWRVCGFRQMEETRLEDEGELLTDDEGLIQVT